MQKVINKMQKVINKIKQSTLYLLLFSFFLCALALPGKGQAQTVHAEEEEPLQRLEFGDYSGDTKELFEATSLYLVAGADYGVFEPYAIFSAADDGANIVTLSPDYGKKINEVDYFTGSLTTHVFGGDFYFQGNFSIDFSKIGTAESYAVVINPCYNAGVSQQIFYTKKKSYSFEFEQFYNVKENAFGSIAICKMVERNFDDNINVYNPYPIFKNLKRYTGSGQYSQKNYIMYPSRCDYGDGWVLTTTYRSFSNEQQDGLLELRAGAMYVGPVDVYRVLPNSWEGFPPLVKDMSEFIDTATFTVNQHFYTYENGVWTENDKYYFMYYPGDINALEFPHLIIFTDGYIETENTVIWSAQPAFGKWGGGDEDTPWISYFNYVTNKFVGAGDYHPPTDEEKEAEEDVSIRNILIAGGITSVAGMIMGATIAVGAAAGPLGIIAGVIVGGLILGGISIGGGFIINAIKPATDNAIKRLREFLFNLPKWLKELPKKILAVVGVGGAIFLVIYIIVNLIDKKLLK